MDKDINKSTVNQLFKAIKTEKFLNHAKSLKFDAYAKKLTAVNLIQMLSYYENQDTLYRLLRGKHLEI